jgi:hypothetical protein
MGGTKLQTPVGKVTSRRFVADSLMKSYKENTAALVAHSKLRENSTEGQPGVTPVAQPREVQARPQSARPAAKDGEQDIIRHRDPFGVWRTFDTCLVGNRALRKDPRATSPMFQEMRLTKVDISASFQFEFKVR